MRVTSVVPAEPDDFCAGAASDGDKPAATDNRRAAKAANGDETGMVLPYALQDWILPPLYATSAALALIMPLHCRISFRAGPAAQLLNSNSNKVLGLRLAEFSWLERWPLPQFWAQGAHDGTPPTVSVWRGR